MKFSNQDIINYYDHTQPHYRQWWKMEESMGLHYGVWDESVKTLSEAIVNTNAQLAAMGQISQADKVLDAGCGVGGSAIFLAKKYGCEVKGITLSERQVATATEFSKKERSPIWPPSSRWTTPKLDFLTTTSMLFGRSKACKPLPIKPCFSKKCKGCLNLAGDS
ncbi:MAG: class I SAM-dependent methyltransferase [Saprospiraceae bacterium]